MLKAFAIIFSIFVSGSAWGYAKASGSLPEDPLKQLANAISASADAADWPVHLAEGPGQASLEDSAEEQPHSEEEPALQALKSAIERAGPHQDFFRPHADIIFVIIMDGFPDTGPGKTAVH